MEVFQVIGLMSGTSLDGIDAALIKTDGHHMIERLGFISVPYEDGLRDKLRGCLNKPVTETRDVEREMTIAHADLVKKLLAQEGLNPSDIDLIGFHGQTIAHAPDQGITCQIGDGGLLAELTGITVVNDFRTADVSAGGQGAPLAPVYHRALLMAKEKAPAVFLNIGGVANVTYVGMNGDILAFDTGPGNALIDDWVSSKTGKRYDENGALASTGRVDDGVLKTLLSHTFFKKEPPKSLDRNDFVSDIWHGLSVTDGAATLTAFTVQSIAQSVSFMPEKPKNWVVSGGGRLNDFMMAEIAKAVDAQVLPVETLGLNGDAIEAEAFAYMAVRHKKGLPISFPTTTGVPNDMTGGTINHLSADAA